MPEFIDTLQQGSNVWLNWRRNFIGGSDASLIAAYFLPDCDWPYGNWAGAELYKLWALKCGRTLVKPKPDSEWDLDPRVHGRRTEDAARDWYSLETGELAAPLCVQHSEVEYLAASLDGWTGTRAVEIKCPTEPQGHNEAKEGKVPDRYYAQCQHNLFVCGCEQLDYVSFYKGEGVIIEVTRDLPFLAQLRNAEDTFWGWVTSKLFGGLPPLAELEIDERNAPNFQAFGQLLEDYWRCQTLSRQVEAETRRLRLALMRAMPAAKVKGFEATVALRVRPASEVKAFTKDEGLVLDVRRA